MQRPLMMPEREDGFLSRLLDLKAAPADARLRIAYNLSEQLQREFLTWSSPSIVAMLSSLAGQLSDLPRGYGHAAVSVLPSLWEPFGLVVIESLPPERPWSGLGPGL